MVSILSPLSCLSSLHPVSYFSLVATIKRILLQFTTGRQEASYILDQSQKVKSMASVGETNSNLSHAETTTLNSGPKVKVKWGHFLATSQKDKCAASAHLTQFTLLEGPKEIYIAGVAILPHHLSLPTRERCSASTKKNTTHMHIYIREEMTV